MFSVSFAITRYTHWTAHNIEYACISYGKAFANNFIVDYIQTILSERKREKEEKYVNDFCIWSD